MTFVFGKNYATYWEEKVKNAGQGPKVPEKDVQNFFIQKLKISKSDTVLDLGCGHGALFPVIKKFTQHITGIDVNKEALVEAAKYSYQKVSKGSAEKTGLPSDHFNKVIAWAVYDVVEQEQSLAEEHRILKTGGRLLVTGKNKNYFADDKEGFIAERNAKLKDFPNHFTDVKKLIREAGVFGFTVERAYGFPRRGDFGTLTYFDIKKKPAAKFYEFLLILKKTGDLVPEKIKKIRICGEFSDTAQALAKKLQKNKSNNMGAFFKWHKDTYGN